MSPPFLLRLPRAGFRMRLALSFLGSFVLAAAVLLTIEYAVVSTLFDTSIASAFVAVSDDTGGNGNVNGNGNGGHSGDGSSVWLASPPGEPPEDVVVSLIVDSQTSTRDEVLAGLLAWSLCALVAFSLAGSGLAWWLSGRPLRRIREVTRLARTISEHDLAGRLDLAGPPDEVRNLADTFDAMLARLQAAFESQATFIANASHELRTPLTIGRTALEVGLRQHSTPELAAVMHRALRANRRGELLLESLLTLAGTQREHPPNRQQVSLIRLIQEELDARSADIRDAGLEVRVDAGPELVTIDPGLFALVVSNLVANAIAYNHPGGIVWISSYPHPDGTALYISNSGPEVTDDPADLMKPFHRGSSSRLAQGARPTGSGLGLAIAASAASALGGTLALEARAEGGLTAGLVLPGISALRKDAKCP